MIERRGWALGFGLVLLVSLTARGVARAGGQGLGGGARTLRDVEYARVGAKPLLLDLYLPPSPARPLPLIIWIHGSSWDDGDKSDSPPLMVTKQGFALASINYRLSHEAIFPAQIHDCK